MEKFKSKLKSALIILSILLMFVGVGFLESCDIDEFDSIPDMPTGDGAVIENESKAIKANIKTSIYEYDVATNETGAEILDGTILCKKRYKFIFELEFNSESLQRLGDNALTVDLYVTMGDYENEDNKRHIISQNINGGILSWSSHAPNEYVTHFKISKDTVSINSDEKNKSYFIIGIDDLDEDPVKNNHPIKISIASTKWIIIDQASSTYNYNIKPIKSYYDWSKNNVVALKGQNFKRNTRQITIPKYATKIIMELYDDPNKESLLGYFEFNESNNLSEFREGKIRIVLSDLLKEAIGDSAYEDLALDHDSYDLYVDYSIPGDKNFNPSTFSKKEVIELW